VTSRTSLHALIFALALLSSGAALGAEQGTTAPAAPTPAARQQMAAVHELDQVISIVAAPSCGTIVQRLWWNCSTPGRCGTDTTVACGSRSSISS